MGKTFRRMFEQENSCLCQICERLELILHILQFAMTKVWTQVHQNKLSRILLDEEKTGQVNSLFLCARDALVYFENNWPVIFKILSAQIFEINK